MPTPKKRTGPQFQIRADDLVRALYGKGIDYVNRGFYEGTKMRVRKVPAGAILEVKDKGRITVTDRDGGWIADRITGGTLGRRELKRVVEYLAKKAKRRR